MKNRPRVQGTDFEKNAGELPVRYRLILEFARDIILFIRQRDGRIFEANEIAVKTYGYSGKKLLSLTIFDLRAPEEQAAAAAQMEKADAPSGVLFETVHIDKHGKRFPVEVSAKGTWMGDEQILISIVRDITDRKRAEEKLRVSDENIRVLLNATRESFFLMDVRGTILVANQAVAERMGMKSAEEITGKNGYDFLPSNVARHRKMQIAKVVKTGKPLRFEDMRGGHYIDQAVYPVFDIKGRVDRLAVYGTDITEYRKMEEKLRVLALTDQLTGLYNRRGFHILAERQLKIARRSEQKLLLFYIDLDGMKKINDTLGHEEGDRALLNTAQALIMTFRESDIIARLGGDEFTVLAINSTGESEKKMSERFRNEIGRLTLGRGKKKFTLSVSIGVAVYHPGEASSLQDLITTADKRMYEEKNRKRSKRAQETK